MAKINTPVKITEDPPEAPQAIERVTENQADVELRGMAQDEATELGIRDMTIPRLLLVQPTSDFPQAPAHQGYWYNSVTGEFRQSIHAIVVWTTIQRAVFPHPFTTGSPVLCASPNGKKPSSEYLGRTVEGATIQDDCESCPLAQWTPNADDKNDPPRCSLMYLYTGIDEESGLPFSLRLKGAALRPARNLNTIWSQFRHRVVFEIGSEEKKGQGRKYFIPTVAMHKPTPKGRLEDLAQIMLASLNRGGPTPGSPDVTDHPMADDDIPF